MQGLGELPGSNAEVGDLVPSSAVLGRTTLEETDSVFWSLQLHDDQIICHSLHSAFFTALQAGGSGKGPTRCFREGDGQGNRQYTYKKHKQRKNAIMWMSLKERRCQSVFSSTSL